MTSDYNNVHIDTLYTPDPNFQDLQLKRAQLLTKLPPPNITNNYDELITNSINLSLKYLKGADYFVSKKLKSAKDRPDGEELMMKMLKKFEIDEYGTNFAKDVFDPKKIGDESVIEDKKMLKPTIPNSFEQQKKMSMKQL